MVELLDIAIKHLQLVVQAAIRNNHKLSKENIVYMRRKRVYSVRTLMCMSIGNYYEVKCVTFVFV